MNLLEPGVPIKQRVTIYELDSYSLFVELEATQMFTIDIKLSFYDHIIL